MISPCLRRYCFLLTRLLAHSLTLRYITGFASAGGPNDRKRLIMKLHVTSEVGKLEAVLVHLPGQEIDRMGPSMMDDLLFDDILYGDGAREEHRRFQQILRTAWKEDKDTVEVLDIQDLLEEILADSDIKEEVLADLALKLQIPEGAMRPIWEATAEQAAAMLIEGIVRESGQITDRLESLYVLTPLPNCFFARDTQIV